jgi:hypothetical protein
MIIFLLFHSKGLLFDDIFTDLMKNIHNLHKLLTGQGSVANYVFCNRHLI